MGATNPTAPTLVQANSRTYPNIFDEMPHAVSSAVATTNRKAMRERPCTSCFSNSFQPEQRLRDGNVAFDLGIRRIGFEFTPQFEILRLIQGQAGEQ